MENIAAGHLTRRNSEKEDIYTVKVLIFKQNRAHYSVCLELGIIGKGNTYEDSIHDLTVLLEDNFQFKAKSKVPVKTVPVEAKYFEEFNKIQANTQPKHSYLKVVWSYSLSQ